MENLIFNQSFINDEADTWKSKPTYQARLFLW